MISGTAGRRRATRFRIRKGDSRAFNAERAAVTLYGVLTFAKKCADLCRVLTVDYEYRFLFCVWFTAALLSLCLILLPLFFPSLAEVTNYLIRDGIMMVPVRTTGCEGLASTCTVTADFGDGLAFSFHQERDYALFGMPLNIRNDGVMFLALTLHFLSFLVPGLIYTLLVPLGLCRYLFYANEKASDFYHKRFFTGFTLFPIVAYIPLLQYSFFLYHFFYYENFLNTDPGAALDLSNFISDIVIFSICHLIVLKVLLRYFFRRLLFGHSMWDQELWLDSKR
ncbi:MAG: hypothetical protein RLW87_21340 [Alphaproteobacteria bacterium]